MLPQLYAPSVWSYVSKLLELLFSCHFEAGKMTANFSAIAPLLPYRAEHVSGYFHGPLNDILELEEKRLFMLEETDAFTPFQHLSGF